MRLFVAIRLPEEVVDDLDAALDAVRSESRELRWVPRQRWHLTLAFFGDVPERELAAVRARTARRVSRGRAMSLQLRGAGRFCDRVLWIGVAGDVHQLRSLATTIAYVERPYRAHLTVARSRQGFDLRPVVERLGTYAGLPWSASTVELIQSHLGPTPTYETLDAWPLAAARPADR